jgi:hypothetical protein
MDLETLTQLATIASGTAATFSTIAKIISSTRRRRGRSVAGP